MKSKKSAKRRLADERDDDDDSEDSGKGSSKKKGYDDGLDKCVREIGRIEGDGGRGGDIVVRLMSYNKGPVKIAVGMCGEKKDGTPWFAKLSRITGDQCEKLVPLMRKARKRIAKYED